MLPLLQQSILIQRAGAGVVACAVISRLVTGKTDVVMMLNGAEVVL